MNSRRSRQRGHARRAAWAAALVGASLCGCVHPAAVGGGDADASMAALRADLRGMNAALVQMRTEMTAGRDIQNNDPWTLRLLGAGLLLLGLSFPIGKLVWTMVGGDRLRRGSADPWPMSGKPSPSQSCRDSQSNSMEFLPMPPTR